MAKEAKPDRSDFLSIFKRGAASIAPHELTLITDPDDSLFDRRVFNDIKDEALLNIAAVGFVQPIAVRLRGNDAIVVDGQQRTKRGLVINHLTGQHAYTGDIPAVLAAIKRLSAPDSAIGKRIIELCPRGVKVPISVHRGEEGDAYAAKVSANEFREGDPIIEKARKAQSLAKHGHDEKDIASMFNVHVQTVKRWLVMDTAKVRAVRKPRSKSVRPTPRRIKEVLECSAELRLTARDCAVIEWVLGTRAAEDVFPKLAEKAAA